EALHNFVITRFSSIGIGLRKRSPNPYKPRLQLTGTFVSKDQRPRACRQYGVNQNCKPCASVDLQFHIRKHPGTQLVLRIIKINANAGSSFHRVQSAINGTNLTFKLLARKRWERNIQLLSNPQEPHFVLVKICPKP